MKPPKLNPLIKEAVLARLTAARIHNDGPLSKGALASTLETSTRQVELCINSLRAEYIPICSDGHGYWLAVTPEELDHTVRQLTHRISQQNRTLQAVIAARQRMLRIRDVEPGGQARLFAGAHT